MPHFLCVKSPFRRRRERSARSPVLTTRTHSLSKPAQVTIERPRSGLERSWRGPHEPSKPSCCWAGGRSALKVVDGRSDRSVLGWAVRNSSPEFVLLGADSRIGMPGELLFKRGHDALLFATFVQQDNLIARTVWAATETAHVRVVRQILEQASRRHRAHARNDG